MKSKRDRNAEKYNAGIAKILPGLEIGSIFSMYSGEGPSSGKISFSNQSKVLREILSPISQTHFIHYTSIENLFNILNTGVLRLCDLNNLNDPGEMIFGLNQFKDKFKFDMNEYKRTHFVNCLCGYDMQLENDEFLMWQLYGLDGNGVGLVYELTNPNDEWHNVFFGKMQYGTNNKAYQKLCEFVEFHENFQKEENLFENIPAIIPAMSMFFKNEIWKHEQEYRLFTFCDYDKYHMEPKAFNGNASWLSNELQFSISKKNKRLAYINYPINFESKRAYFEKKHDQELACKMMASIPNLKLVRVVCGYRVDNNLEYEILNLLENIAPKKVGNPVQVGHTKLKKHFI